MYHLSSLIAWNKLHVSAGKGQSCSSRYNIPRSRVPLSVLDKQQNRLLWASPDLRGLQSHLPQITSQQCCCGCSALRTQEHDKVCNYRSQDLCLYFPIRLPHSFSAVKDNRFSWPCTASVQRLEELLRFLPVLISVNLWLWNHNTECSLNIPG